MLTFVDESEGARPGAASRGPCHRGAAGDRAATPSGG